MARTLETLRWTIAKAASEFKIDKDTLSKRIKQADIGPRKDGTFTTLQICAAVYGDLHGERLRNERLDADLKQVKLNEANGKLLPIASVQSAWEFLIVNLRQKILHNQKLSKEVALDLLSELRSIPVNDYRPSENVAATSGGDS